MTTFTAHNLHQFSNLSETAHSHATSREKSSGRLSMDLLAEFDLRSDALGRA
jgi:hypothetical protein